MQWTLQPSHADSSHDSVPFCDGTPLQPAFTLRNRLGLLRSHSGRYELQPNPDSAGGPLDLRLNQVVAVHGCAPLNTLDEITRHLSEYRV